MKTPKNNSRLVEVPLNTTARVGFGVADFGFNLFYTGLNLFLLYYYTDVLGIRPAIAGLIFALPLFWDAITDPVMGVIAARTRSRWGSFRPYLIFGIVPLAVSFVLMFAAPLLFPGAVVLASAAAHVLFRTCYTVVSIPYSALSARMTRNSSERGSLAGVRMIFATLGGLFTVFTMLPLANWMGDGDLKVGFVGVAALYGTLASVILAITFALTREQPLPPVGEPQGMGDIWRVLRGNRALWILLVAIVFGATGSAIFGKALVYYVKYVAGLDISITTALIALTAAVSLSVPVWMLVSKRIEKRVVWLSGAAATLVAQSLLYFTPPQTVPLFLCVIVLLGFGTAAFNVTFWSMLPDTVEYGQWRSGVRDEGVVFGINQLALKAASGLGIGLLGVLLEAIGYVANQPQSAATVSALRHVAILLPMLLGLAAACVISFYPVNRRLHGRLLRIIDRRAARIQPQASVDAG